MEPAADRVRLNQDVDDQTPCARRAGKRKERRDSGGTLDNRKIGRSNSEERNLPEFEVNEEQMRRVASHEDFDKCKRPAAPLHELNRDSYDSSCEIGEKYQGIFGKHIENENCTADYYRKYSKNDCSPSRSRIHEYILFPKRISPNRDPGLEGGTPCERGEGDERDHERTRQSERRSRPPGQRARPRRIKPRHSRDNLAASKENDIRLKSNLFDVVEFKKCEKKDSVADDSKRGLSSLLDRDSLELLSPPTAFSFAPIEPEILIPTKTTHIESVAETSQKSPLSLAGSFKKNRERSQSPCKRSVSPIKKFSLIDLTTLHGQLGQNEPIPSVPIKYTGFPWDPSTSQSIADYNSEPVLDDNICGYNEEILEIRNQRRTLSDKGEKSGNNDSIGNIMEPEERLNKIAKKLLALKKKIAKAEGEFEVSHGYRASQSDKMLDPALGKLYAEVRKLKNERKSIKAGPGESLLRAASIDKEHPLKNKPMGEIMAEIEMRLEAKRSQLGRPGRLEACSRVQLAEEKAAVQRALLWLEGALGRPTARGDRDAARPLYDRYRQVKRLVNRFDAMKLNNSGGDLATIMENETMLFKSTSNITTEDKPDPISPLAEISEGDSPAEQQDTFPGPSIQVDASTNVKAAAAVEVVTSPEALGGTMSPPEADTASSTASEDTNIQMQQTDSGLDQNLHCMPLSDLNKLLSDTRMLKANLKRSIKAFESEFESKNGRKVMKDERHAILPTYAKYKETKARVRLLTALANKHK